MVPEPWNCEHCLQPTTRVIGGIPARFCSDRCQKCEFESTNEETGCDLICGNSLESEDEI